MAGNEQNGKVRRLAEMEADLVRAEEAYADADRRLKTALADRLSAIETINAHQNEIDRQFCEMRRRSVAGTKWHPKEMDDAEPLQLDRDSEVPDSVAERDFEPPLASRETEALLIDKFARLKEVDRPENKDPVLKVVFGPKG